MASSLRLRCWGHGPSPSPSLLLARLLYSPPPGAEPPPPSGGDTMEKVLVANPKATPTSLLTASFSMASRRFCICKTHISREGIITLWNMSCAATSSPCTAVCLLLLPPSSSSSSSSYGFLRPRPPPVAAATTTSTASFLTLTNAAGATAGAETPLNPISSLSSLSRNLFGLLHALEEGGAHEIGVGAAAEEGGWFEVDAREPLAKMPPSPSPPRAPPRPPPQPSAYKHFCRVCNKGFTCGSALGGHMRAHGVGDDGLGADEDDDEPVPCARGGADGPWGTAGTATHVYALRANPNRLIRSCQACKNCGKEFSSWELFLEHGKCNSGEEEDDADGSLYSSSPQSEADGEEDPALAAGWSKGKRSRRAKLMTAGGDSLPATAPSRCPADEEEDVANFLVMLSSSKVEQASVAETDQESCVSASKEDGRRPQLLQPISFIAPAPDPAMALPLALPAPQYVSPVPRGMFECKACKKVFTSHQALGGHRASHKKVKGCFAAKIESNISESEPPRHAATADPNDDKGKAAAVEVHANSTADGKKIVDASTDGETNAGTSEAAAALTMAITPIDHEPPVAALTVAPYKKKAKMHECSVCHRLFTSGQALGGHKRCHWLTSSTADHANLPPLAAEDLVGAACHQLTLRPMVDAPEPALDLTIAANPSPPVTSAARLAEAGSSSLHLDAPLPVYFQPSAVPSNASHRNKTTATSSHNVHDAAGAGAAADDEADSTTVKRAKLSDLKDVSMAGETTPWLQVGIGSSSAGGDKKSTRE